VEQGGPPRDEVLEPFEPWLLEELEALSLIEPALYPSPEFRKRYLAWKGRVLDDQVAPGRLYASLFPAFVASLPQIALVGEGADIDRPDSALSFHLRMCGEAGSRASVIATTEQTWFCFAGSPLQQPAAQPVPVPREISREDRILVLVRLLLQTPAEHIHVVGSPLGLEVIAKYGRPLRTVGKRIYAGLYGAWAAGCDAGYSARALRNAAPFLERVTIDCDRTRSELLACGVPAERISAAIPPITP